MKNEKVEDVFRLALLVGGIYDLILAAGCSLFLENLYEFFGLNTVILSDTRLFAQSAGLFLVAFGIMLVFASRDKELEKWIIVIILTITLRLVYLPLVLFNVVIHQLPLVFIIIGLTDFFTGMIIFITLFKYRKQTGITES